MGAGVTWETAFYPGRDAFGSLAGAAGGLVAGRATPPDREPLEGMTAAPELAQAPEIDPAQGHLGVDGRGVDATCRHPAGRPEQTGPHGLLVVGEGQEHAH